MVFHGFGLVSIVFQGVFMVFGWFFHLKGQLDPPVSDVTFFKVVSWFFMVFAEKKIIFPLPHYPARPCRP